MAITKSSILPTNVQKKIQQLGLLEPGDFILHFPIRYEDETSIVSIAQAQPGRTVQVEGDIVLAKVSYQPRRHLVAKIVDGTGELQLRWLNFYPSQHKQLIAGKPLRARGEVRVGLFGCEIIHPQISAVTRALPVTFTPIYPTTDGLSQPILRRTIAKVLEQADLRDTLPAKIREKYGLITFERAIRLLHCPTSDIELAALTARTHPAWTRIKFDELLAQQLLLAEARATRHDQCALPLTPVISSCAYISLTNRLIESLPFALTDAQRRVVAEIAADLGRAHPMHRLLQGDVGSGKTIVAALAATQAVEAGTQVALMAPTEILAEQNYTKLSAWLTPLGVQVAWLSRCLPAKQRRNAIEAISNGAAQLLVGTQAVIQTHVQFAKLGLVIVDEQHRFGVAQRLALSRKGNLETNVYVPHQLGMSATPIPRTLAMTLSANLDVSVIDVLPPGRIPVLTKLLADNRRGELLHRISAAARAGQQVYWVCPLVEGNETLELQNVISTYEYMVGTLPDVSVGLIHGRLTLTEKTEVMRAFQSGKLQLLVATTVIEVGVDVPSASLMVVEHAERFGLAQLHQLRGRVGRGAKEAVCVLMYQTPISLVARERLRAMFETNDGFEIARRDLVQRGPGEFFGKRQSGLALLRFANLDLDASLVKSARTLAAHLRVNQPDVAVAHLARWMHGREDFLRT